MALPTFTMRQLIESGVHFGHNTRRWNPKMQQYIFGVRDGVHIIDLQQSVPMLYRAMQVARDVAAKGGRVLFVGTKRQAQLPIKEAAERCGQYFVNHRWLGGTLTNWKTISVSIKRLKEIDAKEEKGEYEGLTKKERLKINREREKLDRSLGGIKDMGGRPDLLFVIDVPKEELALLEAKKLGMALKLHADEIVPIGGTELAAQLGATSADHLLHASDRGIEMMAQAGVVATLLPATAFCLKETYARARKMIDSGCAVALASDLNPGSCFTGSIPLLFALATIYMSMSIEEAITAMTINGAAAVGRAHEIGSIDPGKKADMVILGYPSYHFLHYHTAENIVERVVKEGEVVLENPFC